MTLLYKSHPQRLLDPLFLPPLEIPTCEEILEHLKQFLIHMIIGNNTNCEMVLAAYPKYFQEFLSPSSFMVTQLSKYMVIPEETISILPYIEKIKGSSGSGNGSISFSSSWYSLLSVLSSDIETPLLVWNVVTLKYLHTELKRLEDCLDFMRQLR